MTEPVSPPYKLPTEVLRLLGDDATPERAIEKLEAGATRNIERVRQEWTPTVAFASKAWWLAIAVAAIRAMEATAARERAREERDNLHDLIQAELKAVADYHALRDWRKA